MKSRFDLVLFDLDGTLTDSSPGIIGGLTKAFRHVGWPVPDRKILRKFIGPPLYNILGQLFPEMPKQTVDELVDWYRGYYATQGAFENEVYPGIFGLLAELRKSGARLAVATSKPATPTGHVLDHFDLTRRFDYVSAESDSDYGGGKEKLILPILQKAGVPASRAVMVGDTKYDAAGARNAGTRFVGVLYGFGTREEMEQEGGKTFAASVPELRRFLFDKI